LRGDIETKKAPIDQSSERPMEAMRESILSPQGNYSTALQSNTSEVEHGREIKKVFQPSVPACNSAEEEETSLASFDGIPLWLSFSAVSR